MQLYNAVLFGCVLLLGSTWLDSATASPAGWNPFSKDDTTATTDDQGVEEPSAAEADLVDRQIDNVDEPTVASHRLNDDTLAYPTEVDPSASSLRTQADNQIPVSSDQASALYDLEETSSRDVKSAPSTSTDTDLPTHRRSLPGECNSSASSLRTQADNQIPVSSDQNPSLYDRRETYPRDAKSAPSTSTDTELPTVGRTSTNLISRPPSREREGKSKSRCWGCKKSKRASSNPEAGSKKKSLSRDVDPEAAPQKSDAKTCCWGRRAKPSASDETITRAPTREHAKIGCFGGCCTPCCGCCNRKEKSSAAAQPTRSVTTQKEAKETKFERRPSRCNCWRKPHTDSNAGERVSRPHA